MNNQENLSKKERRELRRQERRQEGEAFRKNKKFKKIIWWIAAAVILAVLVYALWLRVRSQAPQSEDFSRVFEELPRSHVQAGTSVNVYNSNPPTSGPHWPNPLPRGVYDEEQPDEPIVHNLEHGEIWIAYHPRISAEAAQELESIARRYSKIIMTPRSKNDTDIALVAWMRLDAFNLEGKMPDKDRVEDFIKRYLNKGPELIP